MSNDQEIQVKFGADIQGLLEGLKTSQESLETATDGMKGNLGSMIEAFEKFGAAALAIGAVGLAFEGLKEGFNFAMEAIENTNALARTFESLNYQTGESYESLGVMNTAMEMTGGSAQEMTGWMKGATRAMNQHSEMLVANGIAADGAALRSLPFEEYLKRVMEKADQIEEPFRRSQFLTEALGRAGAEAAPQIRRMLETMEEADGVFSAYGARVDADVLARMKEFERETGVFKVASETMEKDIAANAMGMARAWLDAKMVFLGLVDSIVSGENKMKNLPPPKDDNIWTSRGMRKKDEHGIAKPDYNQGDTDENLSQPAQTATGWAKVVDLQKQVIAYDEEIRKPKAHQNQAIIRLGNDPMGLKSPEAPAGPGAGVVGAPKPEAPQKDAGVLQKELDDAKAAAAQRVALAIETAQATAKATLDGLEMEKKGTESLLTQGKITFEDMLQEARQNAGDKLAAQTKASEEELKLAQGNAPKIHTITLAMEQDKRTYYANLADLDNKASEHQVEEAKKAAKLTQELAKLDAEAQLRASKEVLASQKNTLDQKVAMGQISLLTEVEARKRAVLQEEALDMAALEKRKAAAKNDPVDFKKVQDEMVALKTKATDQLASLDRKLVQGWKHDVDGMTSGWTDSITKMINGQESFKQGIRAMALEVGQNLEKMFVKMGIDAVENYLIAQVAAKTGNMTEATSAAAVYAVNAMASVAAIPVYGWAAAPGVGAEAYGAGLAMAGLASAAGGWERVPADQLAMIHKNEQILPADYAEGLRNLVANQGRGGGGSGGSGGGHTLNIHSMDAKSVMKFFQKPGNQAALMRGLSGALRTGRS